MWCVVSSFISSSRGTIKHSTMSVVTGGAWTIRAIRPTRVGSSSSFHGHGSVRRRRFTTAKQPPQRRRQVPFSGVCPSTTITTCASSSSSSSCWIPCGLWYSSSSSCWWKHLYCYYWLWSATSVVSATAVGQSQAVGLVVGQEYHGHRDIPTWSSWTLRQRGRRRYPQPQQQSFGVLEGVAAAAALGTPRTTISRRNPPFVSSRRTITTGSGGFAVFPREEEPTTQWLTRSSSSSSFWEPDPNTPTTTDTTTTNHNNQKNHHLFPFQQEGVEFLKRQERVLLADEVRT